MKTRFDKALNNVYSESSTIQNINKSIELANNMQIIDILEPTSKTIGEVAEIISRLQNADSLETVDIELFSSKLHSYS
jgi:ACT domain-containing protein|tara:strand:- start:352 stop:585 length:234 start_codon:yes stop_codon:yes gene_type:complete